MMTSRSFSLVCIALMGLGLLGSVAVGVQRWHIEAANRTVEVVVDYDEAVLLAQQNGIGTVQCLRRLKEAGATSVAIQERTLETLVRDGTLRPRPSSRWGETLFSLQRPAATLASLVPYLQSKVQGARLESQPAPRVGNLVMPTPTEALWRTGLGLPPEALKEVSKAGLLTVARPANDTLVSQQYLQRLFSDLSKAGVEKVVFDGKSVLGFPGLLEETAQGLSEEGLTYCWVEFAEQLGSERLARFLNYRQIRLHSINPEEMVRLRPREALDRLLRAAKERNIRLLYVHLPLSQSSDARAAPLEFVGTLSSALKENGFRLGQAEPLSDYSPHPIWVFLVVLGICASPLVLLNYWGLGSPRLLGVLLLVVTVAGVGLVLGVDRLGRPLLALLAAVVIPILAIAVLFPPAKTSAPGNPLGLGSAVKGALLRLVGCVAISLVGGLFVAAMLSKSSYFVGGELFRGIKLAQIFPLVVIFFLLIAEVGSQGRWQTSRAKINQFMGLNLQVKHLLGLLFLLLVAAFWIMRTGNQPTVGTSPLEMKMRDFLEGALGARPRAKEFLIGHPLLLLGMVMLTLRSTSAARFWGSALLLVGAIGQVSVVNTFCHLHSPLYLALWRTFNGLWLGSLLGVLLALLFFARWPFKRQPTLEARTGTESPADEPR